MEIKYQELVKSVNKYISVDNIGDEIITGLRSIKLGKFLLEVNDFIDIVYLFSSIVKGDYQFDIKTVASTVLGIVYVVMPADFIPDFLGPLGYADDITVIKLMCNIIKAELNVYRKTEAYRLNRNHGFDIAYMFPLEKFGAYFTSSEFGEVKTKIKTLLPLQGSIIVEETGLVLYNAEKEYNPKDYQNETIAFFSGGLEEVVYVFNNLLYQQKGKCSIKEKDLLEQIILPTKETKLLINKVLSNSEQFYNQELFGNFEKLITSKFNTTEYTFNYEIIKPKDEYFKMETPKIDCYPDSNFNVYNVVYKAKIPFISWTSIYEVINVVKEAKSQNKFKVNYLIMLSDSSSAYQINYNSISKEVRVSTFNSRDIFFERELEELIRKKVK